jgi:hypothetical protein
MLSEGMSVQYDESSRNVDDSAGNGKATIQKWRIHFAKPPSSSTAVALPKPVSTPTLVENLELDEDAVSFFHFSFFLLRHLSVTDLVVI